MIDVVVDSVSDKGDYIYFWADGLDGDARIEDGKAVDAQILHPVADINSGAEREICTQLQQWLEEHPDAL